jgi:hypothetical protein
MPWNATDAERPIREAIRKATASLFGREPTTWKALEKQGERLKPERVSSALRDALETAILVVPEGLQVPDRYAARPTPPPNPPVNGRVLVRWDGDVHEETVLAPEGVTQRSGTEAETIMFDEVEAAPLGPDGTVSLIDRRGIVMTLRPNQLMRGKALGETLKERVGDRVIDLRHDVVGWFELQSLVENHDPESIRAVWKEIEQLAKERGRDERVLVIAFASFGRHRGLAAVTDRRVLHVAAKRQQPVSWWPRDGIAAAELTLGVRGRRLRVTSSEGHHFAFDRVRPRAQATEIQRLLTPIGDG